MSPECSPLGASLCRAAGRPRSGLAPVGRLHPSLAAPVGAFRVLPHAGDAARPPVRAGEWDGTRLVCPGPPWGTAHKCAGKWATLPRGQPAGSK